MTDTARARKLADRIRVVVAETLQRRIKDPRLGYVTITDTRVTGDLREATVFYTVYGDDEERAASAAALESAKGVLRSEVGRQTGVRFTPTLAFVADALPDNARTIDDLLAKARAADEEVRKTATDAQYAGDADPYRKPAADDEDALDDEDGGDAADAADVGDAGDADDGGEGARGEEGAGAGSGSASREEGGSAQA
ncbi:30S ribosome-binding factor RbfA [Actinacidiphila sp. DG2A-62]|uniref:30S ribosome-binding factor RbfA n=1 Tax=Actinacidiphila sp. DG2A-62 TaxID=3108821 RepID=UPI002DB7C018|nr:30S ribosome-binding factor RbfA [Actinacidiphila sp. DG2A-62]MEC3997509.1 30S ribosome-binding factor RbfA [Actinacidiphila sp. DG2A-62]